MPHASIAKLSEEEQQELIDHLNYLNLSEINSLCERLSIPFKTAIRTGEGNIGITKDEDRKGVILAREFWTAGTAPTLAEFAAAWMRASESHTKPNPEWAFLADRARYGNIPNWKQMRAKKAAKALRVLAGLVSVSDINKGER